MLSGDEVYGDDVTSGPASDEPKVFIDITPDYSVTAKFMAFMLAEHGYDNQSYGPVASLIEQIRYLHVNEPKVVQNLIDELTAKAEKITTARIKSVKPIMVHYHEPISMDSYPILCTHCGAEIELIDNRWELAPDGDIEDWDNETGHN